MEKNNIFNEELLLQVLNKNNKNYNKLFYKLINLPIKIINILSNRKSYIKQQ